MTALDDAVILSRVDQALPSVYHYLVRRVGDASLAEDLTSETFLAAVAATKAHATTVWSVGWLIGIARHKLADHWRRQARDERYLAMISGDQREAVWDEPIESSRADVVLAKLNPAERAACDVAIRRWPADGRSCRAARPLDGRDRESACPIAPSLSASCMRVVTTMSDPFEALFTPEGETAPSPEYTAPGSLARSATRWPTNLPRWADPRTRWRTQS